MKNSIRIANLGIVALLFALIFTACSDSISPNYDATEDLVIEDTQHLLANNITECEVSKTFELKAGNGNGRNQTIAGKLSYSIKGENIIVTFSPDNGWAITETHLYVSNNDNDLRRAGNGAPIPGHMPYSSEHNPAEEDEVVFTIPLSETGIVNGGDIFIVGHAVVGEVRGGSVRNTQTAFGGDKKGESNRWYWYISEKYEECDPPVRPTVRRVTRVTTRW